MAKFRQNHQRQGRHGHFFLRAVVFTVVLVLLLLFLFYNFSHWNADFNNDLTIVTDGDNLEATDLAPYMPEYGQSQLVHHKYYSLAYNEDKEQADWVVYRLTRASLKVPNVKRERHYAADYNVKTRSAYHRDYTHSGYTRGHLAPAGDMAFSEEAMKESYFMSNMSPQTRAFNNGVWKELEENIRDWAYREDVLIIVTGPVFESKTPKRIGQNRVAVPDAFFKVVLDQSPPEIKAIGFVIPNDVTDKPLADYAMTVDEVESLTGFNFFRGLETGSFDKDIESAIDIGQWPFSKKRYSLRVTRWNHE